MANPTVVTTTDASGGATYSLPVIINHYITPINVNVRVTVTGTANYDLQYTVSDVKTGFGSAVWLSASGWTGLTASNTFLINFVHTGLRVVQNSGNGSTSTTIVQAGVHTSLTKGDVKGAVFLTTQYAIPYVSDYSGVLQQDDTFKWDSGNKRLFVPASSYLNFGSTGGTSGYGIRDNAGTVEVKSSGGSWNSVANATASVQGATSLTTTGAIAVVTSAGTLGQSANFFWTDASNKLTVQKAGGAEYVSLSGDGGTGGYIRLKATSGSEVGIYTDNASSIGLRLSNSLAVLDGRADPVIWTIGNSVGSWGARITSYGTVQVVAGGTNKHVLIAPSGAGSVGIGPSNTAPTGTASILDRTATTGATSVLIGTDGTNTSATTTKETIRAGASQGSTNLTEWQSNAGAVLSAIAPGGGLILSNASAPTLANSQFTIHAASNTSLVFTMKGNDGVARTATLTLS